MNKLSKLTALLLAIVLALGVPMQVMAESEEITTKTQYIEVADGILAYMIRSQITWEDYTTLTDIIDDTDYADFYYRLTDEEKEELEQIVVDLFWDACITYDKYAPFLPAVLTPATSEASTFSLMSRDGTATVADESTTNNDALVLKKNAKDNEDGTYTITMETYTTGDVTVNVEYDPVDVVLVLDYTGSMDDPIEDNVSTTRIEALKNAITGVKTDHLAAGTGFTDVFAQANDKYIEAMAAAGITVTEGPNRLSIIRYCGGMSTSNVYLLQDWINLDSTNLATVESAVNNANNPGGGTPTGYAMQRALTQMTTNYGTFTEARKKVVILFTDGLPGTNKSFDAEDAVRAVNAATTLKGSTVGATVYTIVVYPEASPSGTYNWSTQSNDVIRINSMLHAISSNFPSATATKGNGQNITYNNTSDGDATKGYYKSAGSAADLSSIFSKLAAEASGSANIQLDSSTVIKDVMSPYFVLPDGVKPADVTVQSYKCTSYDEDTKVAVFSDDPDTTYDATQNYQVTLTGDNTVSVTGFDFNANYVAETGRSETDSTKEGTFHGRKLVISFKVKTTDGFIGGNDVVTNDPSSGVYRPVTDESGNTTLESVKPYPEPAVDVKLRRLQIVGGDQHIYLSNYADLDALLKSFSTIYWIVNKSEDGSETLEGQYEVDGILNEYADLEFVLRVGDEVVAAYHIDDGAEEGTWYLDGDGDGTLFEDGEAVSKPEVLFLLTKDTTYSISYSVKPSTTKEGGVEPTNGTLVATVHVYEPTVTFQDTKHDYLSSVAAEDSAYYNANSFVAASTTWSHKYTDGVTVTFATDNQGTVTGCTVIGATSYTWTSGDTVSYTLGTGDTAVTKTVDMWYNVPTLDFAYAPATTDDWLTDGVVTGTECVPVNVVGVTASTTYVEEDDLGTSYSATTLDVTGHTTSYRITDACTVCGTTENATLKTDVGTHTETVTNEDGSTSDVTVEDSPCEFVIHITDVSGDLIIEKTGLKTGESAIFTATITPPANSGEAVKEYTVVLTGTSADGETTVSVTLADLLANSTYSVVESGDWSWRYTQTNSSGTSGSIVAAGEVKASFTNSRGDQWLDDEVAVKNDFSVNGTGTVID